MVSPYIPIYAVQLGAGSQEMGWLRSLNNLFSNIMQIPWGIICDRAGRYVPFIIIGGVVSSLLWLPILYVTTPWQLILVIAFQALVSSMVAPAWAALIGRILPEFKRGAGTASVNSSASLGSIIAILFSGMLMSYFGGSLSDMYRAPIILAAISGFVGSMIMLAFKEDRAKYNSLENRRWPRLKDFTENRNFRAFLAISFIHSLFMSMAWPLFPITISTITKSNMLKIAYLSSISPAVSLLMRRYTGRLSDRSGRKALMVFGRAGIFVYPFIYAFATSTYHLYTAEFIIGILTAIGDVVVFAYIIDITSEEHRGIATAVYNTVTGLSTFLGSLLGGYMPAFLSGFGLANEVSMKATYLVSSVGRFIGGLLFTRVKESYIYPSSVRKELARILVEDLERAQGSVRKIEELGEKAERGLILDMDYFENLQKKKHRSSSKENSKYKNSVK
jgi:MFS family permease